ncbi:MAG: hypothetical protein R3B90_04350 [Planctomycetaceae bacterium]
MDITTGKARFDVTLNLDADQVWDSVTTFADAQRVYVCVNGLPSTGAHRTEAILVSERPIHGVLTVIDRGTGDIAWSREVLNQHVNVAYPPRWPVLPLATIRSGDVTQKLHERMILDKRTGETLHESTGTNPGRIVAWEVPEDGDAIRLVYGSKMLVIRNAKQPRTTKPADEQPAP